MTTPTTPPKQNKLHFGDNLPIMREHIPAESVDLIYLDPPFNSNATYNVLFRERDSSESAAQIQAFDDTWHWADRVALEYEEIVTNGPNPRTATRPHPAPPVIPAKAGTHPRPHAAPKNRRRAS